MRRRLWWQICLVDSQSGDTQVSRYKVSEEMFDSKMPANTDDANLEPAMLRAPVLVNGWTDMTVFLIRCELWKLSRRLQSSKASNVDESFHVFNQVRPMVEDTYLKYLHPDLPLHSFIATSVRLFLAKVDLLLQIKHKSARTTEGLQAGTPQNNKLFTSSLSIIEYTYVLRNESGWNGWNWQIHGLQPPWHALHIVLDQLRTRSWEPICERAWCSAKQSIDSLPAAVQGDGRYHRLQALVSVVQRNRTDRLEHPGDGVLTNLRAGPTSGTVETSPDPLAQIGAGGTDPTWTIQAPFLTLPDDSDNTAFSDTLNLNMDWQTWDEITLGLNPSLEFWDVNGL